MNDRTFIIVSNRLPVDISKVNGKLVFGVSSGGLATAMSSLDLANAQKAWIGWPGISSDELTSAERGVITRKLKAYNCVPVFLTSAQIKNFYEGYANSTIWPLFHYFQAFAQFNNDYWPAYREVNQLFAKAVARHAAPTATIWVHDYHFTLLPRMLRKILPASTIGFFLHIPFPDFETFRLMPERKDILQGMLGADLIGFHTYDYARYFMNSTMRALGHEVHNGAIILDDRRVMTDAFPISIDYKKFTQYLDDPATRKEITVLEERYDGQKIILSVDRLDYSKGIPNRLRAFEEFLEQNPRFHKKVVLVMIAVPSRVEVQTYKDLREEIEQTVSRINGTYSTLDWTPISYRFQNLPLEQLVALYAKAAVALVTPLRDGMNLVAKEYIACKQRTPGVLILSELTGAADELQEALRINPNDIPTIVAALKTALTMPLKQQRQRMHSMQKRISHYTVQRWASDFIGELHEAVQTRSDNTQIIAPKQQEEIVQHFKQARERAIFLDYDGTIANFVNTPNPSSAKPTRQLIHLLRTIATLPNTRLHIVSGRTREALESWFGALPVTLVAEHGSWIKQRGEWARTLFSFRDTKALLLPLLEHYAERTPGAFIEEKDFALVWHYRTVKPELAYARNSNLRHDVQALIADTDVGVFNGNKIIEIKPRSAQKGTVVSEFLESDPADFIFCAGDDYTDEDMFVALAEAAYTVKVGPGKTQAHFRVGSVEKLLTILQSLASAGLDKSQD